MANTRVLNSSRAVVQKPPALSSSQTSSTGSSMASSASVSIPPSAAGARSVRQSSYAQAYTAAASASQSNSNPVIRSAVSRSVAGPSVCVNVSAESVGSTSGRTRVTPGMQAFYYCIVG